MKSKKLFVGVYFVFAFVICLMFCGCFGENIEKIEENYNLQDLTVFCESTGNIIYDGTPQEVTVVIKTKTGETIEKVSPNVESNDFVVEYYNNINVGTAEVVISAKSTSKYKGTVKLTYTIKPAITNTDNEETLLALLSSGNYSTIYIISDITISENKALNIPQETTLNCLDYSLINNGEIINDGVIEIRRKDQKAGFVNNGEVVNNNRVVMYASQIMNNGKLDNNGEILSVDGYSSLYTNEQLSYDTGMIGNNVNVYTRSSIEEAELALEYSKKEYTGKSLCPKVTVSLDGEAISADEYEVYYDNNVNKGKASVLVCAKETSSILFGEKTIYFDIEGTTVDVNNEDDLIQKLDDPNYSKIEISRKTIDKDIVIGSDKTVYVYSGTEFNGNVTINGTLIVLTLDTTPAKLNGDIIIEKSGQLCNQGKIILKGSISGQGEALNSNEGKIIVVANQDASLEWENEGSIFINDGYTINTRGTGSVAPRFCLTANDISIPSNQYDGKVKYPSIDWNDKNAPQVGSFSVDAYKKDTGEHVLSPKDKGNYIVKVIFREYCEEYYGEVSLDYIILPGETTVNNAQKIYDAVKNENYCKITLEKNTEEIQEFNLPITINSGCELIINENVNFSNKTTICVLGKIINNGNYAEANIQNGLIIGEQGSFVFVCVRN